MNVVGTYIGSNVNLFFLYIPLESVCLLIKASTHRRDWTSSAGAAYSYQLLVN